MGEMVTNLCMGKMVTNVNLCMGKMVTNLCMGKMVTNVNLCMGKMVTKTYVWGRWSQKLMYGEDGHKNLCMGKMVTNVNLCMGKMVTNINLDFLCRILFGAELQQSLFPFFLPLSLPLSPSLYVYNK